VPECDPGHVYHLFVVRSPARDALQASLAAAGVETLIHYPLPIPRQQAVASTRPTPCPAADRACAEVLSLPLHPGLSNDDVDAVADAVRKGSTACAH
jgi:dTDP-3-amino-3,4,6-trideoxy-alpha-D-glucose transaminase